MLLKQKKKLTRTRSSQHDVIFISSALTLDEIVSPDRVPANAAASPVVHPFAYIQGGQPPGTDAPELAVLFWR